MRRPKRLRLSELIADVMVRSGRPLGVLSAPFSTETIASTELCNADAAAVGFTAQDLLRSHRSKNLSGAAEPFEIQRRIAGLKGRTLLY